MVENTDKHTLLSAANVTSALYSAFLGPVEQSITFDIVFVRGHGGVTCQAE